MALRVLVEMTRILRTDRKQGLIAIVAMAILPITLALVSEKPISILLSTAATLLLVIAAYIEREWLGLTPLPPLTSICTCGWIKVGIGGTLIALSKEESENNIVRAMGSFLPETQLLWLSIMVSLTVIFACIRPSKPAWRSRSWDDVQSNKGALTRIVFLAGLFAVAWIIVGFSNGTLDRSPENYFKWVLETWRPDSYFVLFSRLRDIFFVGAPLAFQKSKRWPRFFIATTIAAYLVIAMMLGGRGLVMWPLVYMWCGLLITRASKKRILYATVALILSALMLLPLIESYKSELASQEKIETVSSRSNTFISAAGRLVSSGLLTNGKYWGHIGRPIYGCIDALLFNESSSVKPRAGFVRIGNVFTAWIPGSLVPRRVPVRDAHVIAAEANGLSREEAERQDYTVHDCISFGGDMYWRGGWAWVVLGAGGFALMYRAFSMFWYRYAGNENWWGIILLLYPATFLQAMPLGSLGETAWSWTWELPKYVAIVGSVYLLGSLRRIRRVR